MSDGLFKEPTGDPTIEAAMKALEEREGKRGMSRRVGGSSVGKECLRAGWYSFRWASPVVMSAKGLLTVNDGFRGEDYIAGLLRGVPGLQLWTEDPERPGKQISFELVDGHFVGKLDGIVLGLLQAPKTPHVWEAKVVNEKKFTKLKKDVEKFGEKHALEQWDGTYFAQAQMYMHGMKLTRHYLTVASPGVRELVGVRTEYQRERAEMFLGRAESIVFSSGIPSRISKDPAHFGCKWCDHADVCHSGAAPLRNCRTCRWSKPYGEGVWGCELQEKELSYEEQAAGCDKYELREEFAK